MRKTTLFAVAAARIVAGEGIGLPRPLRRASPLRRGTRSIQYKSWRAPRTCRPRISWTTPSCSITPHTKHSLDGDHPPVPNSIEPKSPGPANPRGSCFSGTCASKRIKVRPQGGRNGDMMKRDARSGNRTGLITAPTLIEKYGPRW